jgi:hypothetical protein
MTAGCDLLDALPRCGGQGQLITITIEQITGAVPRPEADFAEKR